MFSATLSQFVLQSFINIADHKLNISKSASSAAGAGLASTGIITLLVSILPDISGTSGNAGTQSSTLITRSLAVGDLTTKDT
jgi:magnesium transporter